MPVAHNSRAYGCYSSSDRMVCTTWPISVFHGTALPVSGTTGYLFIYLAQYIHGTCCNLNIICSGFIFIGQICLYWPFRNIVSPHFTDIGGSAHHNSRGFSVFITTKRLVLSLDITMADRLYPAT